MAFRFADRWQGRIGSLFPDSPNREELLALLEVRDRPYHEWDDTDPQSVYGITKLIGEQEALVLGPAATLAPQHPSPQPVRVVAEHVGQRCRQHDPGAFTEFLVEL